ncbi:hypothetical protein AA0472_2143 [Acetobacter estunensis NRIC 0472]|nr:hypothetical protein AA0472_2143 [Acetobacter estunensis NRIC 0472]
MPHAVSLVFPTGKTHIIFGWKKKIALAGQVEMWSEGCGGGQVYLSTDTTCSAGRSPYPRAFLDTRTTHRSENSDVFITFMP